MKRKALFIAIFLILMLILGFFIIRYFNLKNTLNKNTDSSISHPYLELSVAESPSRIDTVCQRVTFDIKAENTGEKDLEYGDIESGVYSFSLVRKESRTILGSTYNNAQGVHNLYIEDFGKIKVGETKELSFYTKETYVGDFDFGYQNGFNMLQSYGNGSFDYYFEFQKANGGDSYTMLSNLAEVSIDIQAFEYIGTMWSNKICN